MTRAALLVAVAVLLCACAAAGRPTATGVRPDQLVVVRSYGWPSLTSEPQAQWAPAGNRVLAAAKGGFVLLDEGAKPAEFRAEEGRGTWWPQWIDGRTFIFGPARSMYVAAGGEPVPASDGLTVVVLDERGGVASRKRLSPAGYRPRVADAETIVAQAANQVVMIDSRGQQTVFGEGFNPVPEPGGTGLCWQETPVTEPDLWTGKPPLGALVVRWRPGVIDRLPAVIEPVWAPGGRGLYATRLGGEPSARHPWWEVPTEVVRLPGPGAPLQVVVAGGRNPAPHPREPLLAWTAEDGAVMLGDADGGGAVRLAAQGELPRWSADGQRLLVQQAPQEPGQASYLRVLVLGPQR